MTVFVYSSEITGGGVPLIIKLTQAYALTALALLYFGLIISPVTELFGNFPYRNFFKNLQKELIISALFFGVLHSLIAFFGELGGFSGLAFLGRDYLIPVAIGLGTILSLFIYAGAAVSFFVNKYKFLRSRIVKFTVYLAGIFTVIHSLILGSHFINLSNLIPVIFFIALAVLLLLESVRIDRFLHKNFNNIPRLGFVFSLVVALITGTALLSYGPASEKTDSPFNVHAVHIELAKQAQKGNIGGNSLPDSFKKIPGFSGDPTKRFSASFYHPENINPGEEVELRFKVYDANSGQEINFFQINYDKIIHLVVVDSNLEFFDHIHPEQDASGFVIKTSFPHPGQYRLYIDFLPSGAIEQQFAFSLNVGEFDKPQVSNAKPDDLNPKVFGDYKVTLKHPEPLRANDLTIGAQTLTFQIENAKTGEPVTNLKPYLSSFGHLVMINEKTLEYLHVHPSNLVAPKPDETSGPVVDFLPLGLYGPIKPGLYRVFAQFNPDGELFTADFTVEVQ